MLNDFVRNQRTGGSALILQILFHIISHHIIQLAAVHRLQHPLVNAMCELGHFHTVEAVSVYEVRSDTEAS